MKITKSKPLPRGEVARIRHLIERDDYPINGKVDPVARHEEEMRRMLILLDTIDHLQERVDTLEADAHRLRAFAATAHKTLRCAVMDIERVQDEALEIEADLAAKEVAHG